MIGRQCGVEKHSIYLRKVCYLLQDELTGFNLILALARRSASIISVSPWLAEAVQVLSAGVWRDGINHISRLALCLYPPDKSLVFYAGQWPPLTVGLGDSMEGNQLKMVSSAKLTDHEFFIEILILIPATWQSINNEIQLRMSNIEIFIRFIPKQLEIIFVNVV